MAGVPDFIPDVMSDPWIVLAALVLEAVIGYPTALHLALPHPVTWIGAVLAVCEKRWNEPQRARKAWGVVTLVIAVVVTGGAGFLLSHVTGIMPLQTALIVILGTVGLAQRSLHDHVAAVVHAPDLDAARRAVAGIVGRDVESLDGQGVAAAALESLSESFNDGIVAPAFWFLLGGLPGLFIYKAVNTADSMIGHLEPRWRDFGWAAARLDDLLNLLPARLAGALIVLAQGRDWRRGWRVMWADAMKHASPNAGWPEAAMAGALNVRLGGPAQYDGVTHDRPVFGVGAAPSIADVRRGLFTYRNACALLWVLMIAGGLLWRL